MDRWRENNDRARANEWTCRAHYSCRGGPFEQIALGIPPHRAQAKALFRAARTALCTNLLGKSLAFEQGVNYAAHPWGTVGSNGHCTRGLQRSVRRLIEGRIGGVAGR